MKIKQASSALGAALIRPTYRSKNPAPECACRRDNPVSSGGWKIFSARTLKMFGFPQALISSPSSRSKTPGERMTRDWRKSLRLTSGGNWGQPDAARTAFRLFSYKIKRGNIRWKADTVQKMFLWWLIGLQLSPPTCSSSKRFNK